jgi:peptide/nickel transport system substrate-binding protein
MAANHPESPDRDSVNPFTPAMSRRSVLAAGGLGLGALFLAACGGAPSSSLAGSQASGPPKKGGTLRVSVSDADTSDALDPGVVVTINAAMCLNNIFDRLIKIDDTTFQASPSLATEWKPNADATEWTIKLREGVKWHDGSDFTSKDVAFTVRHWLDPKSGSNISLVAAPYMDASGVSTPDASTVVLKLKKPNSIFLESVCISFGSGILKDGTNFSAATVVGTGPFKLKSWKPGQGWSLVRNDDYWNGAPYLDAIEATVTPDQGAKLQGVLAGSTDVTDTFPVALWSGLQGRDNVALETIKAERAWVFTFDQGKAPFNDQRVVEALRLATDRETLLKTAFQGHGAVAADIAVPSESPFYPPGLKSEYDPAKAKQLLADAGYSNGVDIELSTSSGVAGMSDIAQALQQVVKGAGFNVKLKEFPASTYWSKGWLQTPAFQDYWHAAFPSVLFDYFFRKGAVWNGTHHDDPALDKLTTEIYATLDADKRVALSQQALLEARKTYSYLIPLFVDAGYARASKVQGLKWDKVASIDFSRAWIA